MTEEERMAMSEFLVEVPTYTVEDALAYLKVCEVRYDKSTKEFLEEFAANDYEGDVTEQLWYSHAQAIGLTGNKNHSRRV